MRPYLDKSTTMNLKGPTLPAPRYAPSRDTHATRKVGLAVESMRRHMTDEGWQIFDGLQHAGYELWGWNLPPYENTYVPIILSKTNPEVVVMQDKREWDTRPNDFREKRARFNNVAALKDRHDIFKVTILKDAHQRPMYHMTSAQEIGCHAWIAYYDLDTVKSLSGFVRREHLIRTYHTIDPAIVPLYNSMHRKDCLLSGAVSSAYPLRQRLFTYAHQLPDTKVLHHPGYHMLGAATPKFVKFLSTFKVAICTASIYDYALRKIIEATAAGCVVITNLSESNMLPEIDGNLCRVPSEATVPFIADTIKRLIAEYNPEKQKYYSDCAINYYNFREEGIRLSNAIDTLRSRYSQT